MTPGVKTKPKAKTPSGPPKPVGMNTADRASTKAAVGLNRAEEQINALYAERKLYLTGVGLVLGYCNDEFDKFMALEPQKPTDSGSVFEELFGAIADIVSVIPPLSVPIKLGKTAKLLITAGEMTVKHAQQGYATAKTAAEAITKINGIVNEPSDAAPADKGSDAYLREAELKFPLLQKVLSATYMVEYERQDAIKSFRDEVEKKMDDPAFAGTPLTIATEMFGPAPARKTAEEIFEMFAKAKDQIFTEIMKAYVSKYAVIAFHEWVDKDANTKNSFWGLYTGLNDAQWRALLVRCGVMKLTPQLRQIELTKIFRSENTSKLMKALPKYFQDIDAYIDTRLDDPGDLVKFWNARKVVFRNISDWHGFKKTTDWNLVPHR